MVINVISALNQGYFTGNSSHKIGKNPDTVNKVIHNPKGKNPAFLPQAVDNSVDSVDKCPYFRLFSTFNELWTVENPVEVVINSTPKIGNDFTNLKC